MLASTHMDKEMFSDKVLHTHSSSPWQGFCLVKGSHTVRMHSLCCAITCFRCFPEKLILTVAARQVLSGGGVVSVSGNCHHLLPALCCAWGAPRVRICAALKDLLRYSSTFYTPAIVWGFPLLFFFYLFFILCVPFLCCWSPP